MRPIGMLAVVAGTLVLASACSDGGGITPPENTAPVADFAVPPCTIDVACTFASTSTDDAAVTEWSWNFDGDDDPDANTANASFTYDTAGAFQVSLTVQDAEGLSQTKTRAITIAPADSVDPPANTPPTAGFTHTCDAATCSFTSTSTDVAPGTIATHAWTFGDGATAEVNNPSHSYTVTAPTDFIVTLTVTDNEGATGTDTQTVSVSPPPPPPPVAEGCTISGTRVDCALDVTARSTLKLRLLGISCDLPHQRITVPQGDQVFLNVCSKTVGDSTKIFGGPGDTALVFEPGSQVRLRFNQGTADAGEPALAAPAAQVTGTFPNWTISFEDGDNAGGAGEPDFTDVVLGVEAEAAP
jgi:PKD repeat protein